MDTLLALEFRDVNNEKRVVEKRLQICDGMCADLDPMSTSWLHSEEISQVTHQRMLAPDWRT
jgi:hypothetical protein